MKSFFYAMLPVASGILLAAAFAPLDWWWLAFVALVPFAIAIRHADFETFIGAFLGGLIFHLIHMDWMRTVTSGGDRTMHWIVASTGLALTWPVAMFAGKYLRLPMVIGLPLLWVAFEYVRWEIATPIEGNGHPWGQLGLALPITPLMQVADLGGVFAATALVAMVNGAIVDFRRKSFLICGVVLAIATAYGYVRMNFVGPEGPTATVIADGTNYEELVAAAAGADLLISTEGWYRGSHESMLELKCDSTLILGYNRQAHDVLYNSVAFITSQGCIGYYDKRMLTPFSEFKPPVAWLFGDTEPDQFGRGESFPVFQVAGCRVAATICYDAGFPEVYRRFDADIFVVPGSEIHDDSDRVQRFMLRVTRFRAIENRRPFVRATLGGYSGIIDSCGRGTLRREWAAQPIVLGSIPLDDRQTFYRIAGYWFAPLSLAIIGLLYSRDIASRWRARSERRVHRPSGTAPAASSDPARSDRS